MFKGLHFGLYYPSNDTKIFIFGSKLTEKLRITIQHVMEDQSNMVDKERAFIVNKGFPRVVDNVPDDAHTLL